MQTVLWRHKDGIGLERCEVEREPVTRIRGQVLTVLEQQPWFINYQVICSKTGQTKSVQVTCRANGTDTYVSLERTSDGHWLRDGHALPEFHGCSDIDLGVTPSTNTLPIRRLNLDVGDSQEFTAVWLRFPELSLRPLRQRYTRLDADTYLYESLQSGYTAKLQVDEAGVIIVYEATWEQIPVVE